MINELKGKQEYTDKYMFTVEMNRVLSHFTFFLCVRVT